MKNEGGYIVDVWEGNFHQNFAKSRKFREWKSVVEFMRQEVEAGNLCNVLSVSAVEPPGAYLDTGVN